MGRVAYFDEYLSLRASISKKDFVAKFYIKFRPQIRQNMLVLCGNKEIALFLPSSQ